MSISTALATSLFFRHLIPHLFCTCRYFHTFHFSSYPFSFPTPPPRSACLPEACHKNYSTIILNYYNTINNTITIKHCFYSINAPRAASPPHLCRSLPAGRLAGQAGRRGGRAGGWCLYGVVWCGVVWCGVVCDVVWCVVLCGAARRGVLYGVL